MYLISAEGYKNAGTLFLRIRRTDEIWASMRNVHNGLSVKNISDPFKRNIWHLWNKKSYEKANYKIKNDWKRKFWKYANLSEDELSEKSSKNIYVKDDVMATVVKCCRAKKKKRQKKNRWI